MNLEGFRTYLPTPGGPTSTTGRLKSARGNSLATSSYVAISSRSKSSLSAKIENKS